jgi:hypothetical protein
MTYANLELFKGKRELNAFISPPFKIKFIIKEITMKKPQNKTFSHENKEIKPKHCFEGNLMSVFLTI